MVERTCKVLCLCVSVQLRNHSGLANFINNPQTNFIMDLDPCMSNFESVEALLYIIYTYVMYCLHVYVLLREREICRQMDR